MPTTPTDDPRANCGRTVGVHGELNVILKSLKREALVFDQIAVSGFDHNVDGNLDEAYWLQDIGIVRQIPPPSLRDFDTVYHQFLVAFVAETGLPVRDALNYDERERLLTREPDVEDAVWSRMHSIDLRRGGFNAFPVLPTRRQIGNVFPSGTTPVLEVVLKSMPIPDDQTSLGRHH